MKCAVVSLVAVSFFVTNSFCQRTQAIRNYSADAQLLKKAIQANHFRPRNIDDHFSKWVYESFLRELDPNRLVFTQEDFNSIITYKFKIDDDLNLNRWSFLPAVSAVYERALKRADKISSAVLQTQFTFTVPETYQGDTTWAKNDKELNDRWRLALKHDVITRLIEIRNAVSEADESKFLASYEPEARQKVRASTKKLIGRALNHAEGYHNFMGCEFLETIAAAFDPHSNYLTPTKVENFMSAMSSEGYYFGFSLKENLKGEIEVVRLAPGSAAWKSGTLNSGDVIRQVKWDGKEGVDVRGVDIAEVDEVMTESNHSSMELVVEKPTGELETIVLRKEKMATQESVVKSFILQGKKKIGYINLPGFYSKWGESEGAACANDVASEVIKLKAEGVDGLILDLRFNGGGSMMEAVSMAGIFIDAGPVAVVQQRTSEFITLKDFNRGTIYDGPLLVLVNKLSASASEILAAVLQDYNRAIIVGTETYGKATAQNLFPLQKTAGTDILKNASAGIGYSSITIQKIFRITGKTAQLRGVKPDIVLPDLYDSLQIGEVTMPLALASDSISKKIYYQPGRQLPIKYLRSNSESRVKNHTDFQRMMRTSSLVSSLQRTDRPVSLQWVKFQEQNEKLQKLLVEFREVKSETNAFSPDHHSFDKQHMKVDQFVEQFNSMWVKKLKQDVSLGEAFHIICDFIDVSNKK
jgi:carboxyl-terminal processing protease